MKNSEESSVNEDNDIIQNEEEVDVAEDQEEEIAPEPDDNEDSEEKENLDNPEAAQSNEIISNQDNPQNNVSQPEEKINKQNLIPQENKIPSTKKNKIVSPLDTSMPKYFHTEPATSGKSPSSKTNFTKISEELFHKFINGKDNKNVTSPYDYLIHDVFLNRICEKEDHKVKGNFKEFVKRNEEFTKNRSRKIQEKIEQKEAEANSSCLKVSQNKKRTFEEFMKDTVTFCHNRDGSINQQREVQKKAAEAELKFAPKILKKSKEIVQKKDGKRTTSSQNVYERLYTLPNVKAPIPEKKGSSKRVKITTPLKENVKKIVEKLHRGGDKLKKSKEKINNDLLKETHNVYDSEKDLTTESTKKILLDKFVQNYERVLTGLFNKKDSLEISMEEFCTLMFKLGFIKYDHQNEDDASTTGCLKKPSGKGAVTNTKTQQEKKQKEYEILKEAWEFLAKSKGNEVTERIETNQILVFCLGLIGIYKGDENNSQESNKSDEKKKKISENFLKKNLPELDCTKYAYNQKAIKQIKVSFRILHDNLTQFWAEESKKKKEEKKQKLENRSISSLPVGKSTLKLEELAESIRNRISRKILATQEEDLKKELEGYSSQISEKKSPKSQLEAAYVLLRKKKKK